MKTWSAAAFLSLLALMCPAQVLLTTTSTTTAGSGGSDRTVVKGPTGLLHALTVSEDTTTGDRPLLLWTSADGGATWTSAPAPINDASSGLSGANSTNWCAMAIDSAGMLHCTWGGYYYPSSYRQYFCSFDPATNTKSPVVYVTGLVGASTTTRIAAQEIVVDQSDTVWLVSQGTSGSWVEHLLRSTAPGAAGQTFQNLGRISSTASAQATRLAVDFAGRIHAGYYRNTGQGEYYHRIYDPAASSWNVEFRLGNTTAGQDNYGQFAADNFGNVHAVYVLDSSSAVSWGYRYRRYDPLLGWDAEVVIADVPSSNFSGIANYRIFALACDENTGEVHLAFRDLNNGGGLVLLNKDLASPAFSPVGQIGPNSAALHAYLYPAFRGSLFPAFNNTSGDLSLTWCQRVEDPVTLAVTWDWIFQALSTPTPGPTLTLSAPLQIGTIRTLALSAPNDPNLAYLCAFSGADAPGIPLPGGGTVSLAYDALLELSLTLNNGVFFNNFGFLDGVGEASVVIAVPNFPPLVGLTIHSAFVVEDGTTPGLVGTISATLPMTIN